MVVTCGRGGEERSDLIGRAGGLEIQAQIYMYIYGQGAEDEVIRSWPTSRRVS
jgi:hypothetical protein